MINVTVENSVVTLRARVKMPTMPNFLELDAVTPASMDDAMSHGGDRMKVDVGALDDQALSDFCDAWVLAFTRHAKARRNT